MSIKASVILTLVFCLFVIYVPPLLYFCKGWGKRFFHDVLGWHCPYDWKSARCYDTCRYCNKQILQDTQGNWVEVYDNTQDGTDE